MCLTRDVRYHGCVTKLVLSNILPTVSLLLLARIGIFFKMADNHSPLPKADRNSELQARSIAKFQEVLPVNLFVFRDERVDDAGVDGSLEIKIDGYYTNMRAQVQLKSREVKNARQDGVVTLPIETSNFNYLLNGPIGLYVLYIEETHELFYVWATDENRRRFEMNSDWKSQETISIPLQPLNEQALIDIHNRICREAELRREILEALAHSSSDDSISVSINPETLVSTNSIEVEKIIRNSGMTLVAAGYSNIVLEKLKLISQSAVKEPRFNLITAYANYSTGRYQLALGAATEAIISNGLQNEDRKFAERLHTACQLNLGVITEDEYFNESEAKADGDELVYAEIRLQKLIDQFRSQSEPDEEILDEISSLKSKIVDSDKAPDSFKLGARVKYLEAIGLNSVQGVFIEILKASARKINPVIVSIKEQLLDYQIALEQLDRWDKETSKLIEDSVSLGHPIFIADALATRASMKLLGLFSKIGFAEFEETNIEQAALERETLSILDLCEKSQKIYKQADMLEGQVRTQLIMAQVFEIMGQPESAKNLAQGVLNKALYLGYKRHINTARELNAGSTFFSRTVEKIRTIVKQKNNDEYDTSGLDTEEDIQNYVNFMMQTFKIPVDRRENVLQDVMCTRDGIREKSQWCRHIEIHQNLTHASSPLTHYAENPNRRVVCLKFGYMVDRLSPNWLEQIEEFKKLYCSICPNKEPLNIEC